MSTLQYLIIRVFLGIFSLLPLTLSRNIGSGLGWLYYILGPRRVNIARINIQLCFPDITPEEQERLTKHCLQEAGKWVAEVGAVWHWPDEKILRHVHVRNPELLQRAIDDHHGVILALPHMGNWEVINSIISTQYDFACLYKHDKKIPQLSEFIRRQRTRRGITMAPADSQGIRVLYKQLKAGKIAGLLPDHQPTQEMGVFAPFFDQPALTGKLISSLAKKNHAAVLTLAVIRTEKGFEAIYDEVAEQHNDDPVIAATELNKAIERCIKLAPEQFQWVYTRFSKQPNGEVSPYKSLSTR